MSSFVLFYLSASVLFAQSTVAFNCSKKPIYVDIHKRAVHDSPVFQYGSFIGVGGRDDDISVATQAQNQSLWPSLSHNHTSFASHEYCDNSTLKDCDKSTGGFFNFDDSKYFKKEEDFNTLDQGSNGSFSGFFGRDVVRLYTHYFETDGATQTMLRDSVIQVAEEGDITPAIVGVGSASTVLQDLVNADLVTGRTYSLYIGQGFDRANGAVNGSNTFGGYDSGRFTHPVHKYDMDTKKTNPMSVRVKDIYITDSSNPSGNTSLFDSSNFPDTDSKPEPFTAEITTDQYPLSLPYAITQNFISAIGGASPDNTWGDSSLRLDSSSKFNGSLSIVLDDGFTITLPPEVLVNASRLTPIQDRREDEDDKPFYLSTAFLTQVYLMADYESETFFLAPAVQHNKLVMPVPFCPRSTPEPYEPPKQSAWTRQGLIGAVVGGVIGGLGVMCMGYCLYLAWMRRRQEKKLERRLEERESGLAGEVGTVGKGRRENKKLWIEVQDDVPVFDPPPKSSTPFFAWKR